MFCPLGNHVLRGSGEFITNPRHIRFANKFFPDYLPSEKVCAKCKQDIGIAYEYRMKRVLATRARNGSLISSSSTDATSTANNQNSQRNTATNVGQKRTIPPSLTSTYSEDGQPSTSAQAAAKRQRREERHKRVQQQQNLLAINVQRGARLPHIQPVARRRQFVHVNPDIMDIYLKGTTGG